MKSGDLFTVWCVRYEPDFCGVFEALVDFDPEAEWARVGAACPEVTEYRKPAGYVYDSELGAVFARHLLDAGLARVRDATRVWVGHGGECEARPVEARTEVYRVPETEDDDG